MNEIVVIGGGGHAKVLVSVLKKSGYDVLGYTDMQDRGAILGVPYFGPDDALAGLLRAHDNCRAAVGVGKLDPSPNRMAILDSLRALGFSLPVIVSLGATVNEDVQFGPGTVVFDGAVVNSGTVAGRLCILNTNCTVEHDCHLGDDVHIAPGATLSGGVTIGARTMIGTGANVIHNVTICACCTIGAGSTVVNDIAEPGIYVGNPAGRMK
jgi:sugar O-acyltransferase (sialic acid O-acetyltransferase NeuD family)